MAKKKQAPPVEPEVNEEEFNMPIFERLDKAKKLKRIPIKEINPGNRLRTEYHTNKEEWDLFKKSLKERGQLQPIGVMAYDPAVRESMRADYFLLYGGRRLLALQQMGEDKIDAVIYPSDMNSYEIRAVEYEENVRRKDMTIEEEAKGRVQMLQAWRHIYGEKNSTSPNDPGISIRSAAKMLGVHKNTLMDDIKIANMFDQLPEEAKSEIKSRADAKNLIKHADKAVQAKKKVEEIENGMAADDVKELQKQIISCYDVDPSGFLHAIADMPDKSFDLVNFDPDYPVDTDNSPTHKSINAAKQSEHYIPLDKKDFEVFVKASLKEIKRVMKPDAWLIFWFGYEYFQPILNWMKAEKFNVNYLHGKWYKGAGESLDSGKISSHTRNPKRTLGHTMEPFFYAKLGKAEIITPHPDVFTVKNKVAAAKINDYEKPVELMHEIYKTFVMPGSNILSPCAGSGNDILAAINYKCTAYGVDKSRSQFEQFKAKVYSQEVFRYA